MNCLKCGRELEMEQVFCDDCLLEMEKYPVKPGTVVQLPHRRETTNVRKSQFRRKANLPLEDQVKSLRFRVRLLTILLAVVSILLILLSYPAIKEILDEDYLPGQNYTSFSQAETTPY